MREAEAPFKGPRRTFLETRQPFMLAEKRSHDGLVCARILHRTSAARKRRGCL
jgi:hypothetical protein